MYDGGQDVDNNKLLSTLSDLSERLIEIRMLSRKKIVRIFNQVHINPKHLTVVESHRGGS